ncbi:MAG: GNAT family N-acetyltransferase [Pseudomonadota bacterium]
MSKSTPTAIRSDLSVDHITRLDDTDLDALVDATQETIAEGSQSSWRGRPSDERIRAFWTGVSLSPTRQLIVGRLAGAPVGAVQIIQPGPLSEVGPEIATLDNFFLKPDARGFGLARRILRYAEEVARSMGIISLDLVIREDRADAAKMLTALGYTQWARKQTFQLKDNAFEAGLYFNKIIDEAAAGTVERQDVA